VAGNVQQSAVHRVGNGFGLHGRVHDDALELGGLDGFDLYGAFDGGLEQFLQTVFAQQATKSADLCGVALRQALLVVLHAAEELPLHVLGPALDQLLVAQVHAVLEVHQADHQAHWEAWAPGRADAGAKFLLSNRGACQSSGQAESGKSRVSS
jgi:hypothetical protein